MVVGSQVVVGAQVLLEMLLEVLLR